MKYLPRIACYLVFFYSFTLAAQSNSFEYISSSPHDEYLSDLIETPDSNIYYCGGYSALNKPNKRIGTMVVLDKYGVLIDSLHVSYNGKSSFFNILIPSSDYEFITLIMEYDTLGERKDGGFLLSRMDKYLNLFDSVHHSFPVNYRLDFLTATYESDGTTFIGGDILDETNFGRPIFYEFNSNFDSVKAKIFLSEFGEFTKIKSIKNKQYWAMRFGGGRNYILDSALNVVLKKSLPYKLSGNTGVKWDSDTSFFLVGNKLAPLPSHNLGFIRQFDPIDTAGIIYNQWGVSDTIDLPAITNGIDFISKDSIYIGGMRNVHLGYHNPWPSWFIILQTDSMLNVRWERFYGGDAYYLMGKIIASRDGGCIIGGMRYDYQNEPEEQTDIIILKLNEEGILVGDKENPSLETRESIIYPNPGTNEIKVRIATQHSESLFQLFDMNGKQIVSQEIIGKWGTINTDFLKSGTYIYRITSKQGLYESGKWVKN